MHISIVLLKINRQNMLRNYLKVGLRNLLNQKFYSLINILGLTVGLTCSAFIGIYVYDELSYDKFHDDFDKIYRVGITGKLAGVTTPLYIKRGQRILYDEKDLLAWCAQFKKITCTAQSSI